MRLCISALPTRCYYPFGASRDQELPITHTSSPQRCMISVCWRPLVYDYQRLYRWQSTRTILGLRCGRNICAISSVRYHLISFRVCQLPTLYHDPKRLSSGGAASVSQQVKPTSFSPKCQVIQYRCTYTSCRFTCTARAFNSLHLQTCYHAYAYVVKPLRLDRFVWPVSFRSGHLQAILRHLQAVVNTLHNDMPEKPITTRNIDPKLHNRSILSSIRTK